MAVIAPQIIYSTISTGQGDNYEINSNPKHYYSPQLPQDFKLYNYFAVHSRSPISFETVSGTTTQGYSIRFNGWIYKASEYQGRSGRPDETWENPSGEYIAAVPNQSSQNDHKTIQLDLDYFIIEYVVTKYRVYINNMTGDITLTFAGCDCETYSFVTVENRAPLKKWTVAMVIDKLCDLAEPLRKGDTAKYRLNAAQHAKFDKILAPEFSFTKATLRECLQQIGGYIHGEPRLKPVKDGDDYAWEITYDMYASQERSGLYTMPYIKKQVSQVITDYSTSLDSSVDNLINLLKDYSGVIKEPYANGAQSLRTETTYSRIDDTNMLIATAYPIYSIEDIEYIYVQEGVVKAASIKPYVFEETEYNALSSFSSTFPESKLYAVYYTQGSKNIKGLNFKLDSGFFPKFNNYSIIEILRAATGNREFATSNYPEMCFRVTYTPIYGARVGQSKGVINPADKPAATAYNQSANIISVYSYGENMKGAIARLGNIDKTVTCILSRLDQIPKAGQMFDNDYYISAVAWEIYRSCIKCTIGLSKDFNRLSQHIGINSVRRFYEVSERQAAERDLLYREYVYVGFKKTDFDNKLCTQDGFMNGIYNTFLQGASTLSTPAVSRAVAWGTGKSETGATPTVSLPVISSAFGNSISFSWRYDDNYSAGTQAHYETDGSVSGWWQNTYAYGDVYGRIYYYNFDLQAKGYEGADIELPAADTPTESSKIVSTLHTPNLEATGSETTATPFILRKDNREIIQCNFQVDFVTDEKSIIIGSALTAYNPLVRGESFPTAARLYVFPTELNKFTDHIEAWEDVTLALMPYTELTANNVLRANAVGSNNSLVQISNLVAPQSGKSWAIVTPQKTTLKEVWDEDTGTTTTVEEVTGGDLLIGRNVEVAKGETLTDIFFTPTRNIYDTSVWKDRI